MGWSQETGLKIKALKVTTRGRERAPCGAESSVATADCGLGEWAGQEDRDPAGREVGLASSWRVDNSLFPRG